MGVTYDGAASGNIAWTASENKTTEKKTSAFSITLAGNIELSQNNDHLLQIDRSGVSNTTGMITVRVYNVSKIDGTNSKDTLFVTNTVSTTQGTKSMLLGKGVFIGTEGQIKVGVVFAANLTGSNGAATVYYRLYRV